jgi:hypothetical protein
MMEKLAQPGEGGGARPHPFTTSTITDKVVVYAPAEKADAQCTPPISTLSLCVLCDLVPLSRVEMKMFYSLLLRKRKNCCEYDKHFRSSLARNFDFANARHFVLKS